MNTTTESPPTEARISPRRALPTLLDRQDGLCARCGIKLIGPGWHDEGRLAEQPCGCDLHRRHPEAFTSSVAAPGYAFAQVNHKVPRAAGGLHVLSNYEATCGPCNLAHWADWKASTR